MPEAPVGLVLAAGAGRRYGGPKAHVRTDSGDTWLERTCRVLLDGGCSSVIATAPPGTEQVAGATLLPITTTGLSESLDAALEAAEAAGAEAVVVMLVDLPDVTAAVVRRILDSVDAGPTALARATYGGRPGHPVLIGSAHFAPLRAQLAGDTGAGAYLRAAGAATVECGDLATGRDVDRPG